VIAFGEMHLHRLMSMYARYYNEVRAHLVLGTETPVSGPIERMGRTIAEPIIGGLHYCCARI
jgi:hypothetical protein